MLGLGSVVTLGPWTRVRVRVRVSSWVRARVRVRVRGSSCLVGWKVRVRVRVRVSCCQDGGEGQGQGHQAGPGVRTAGHRDSRGGRGARQAVFLTFQKPAHTLTVVLQNFSECMHKQDCSRLPASLF